MGMSASQARFLTLTARKTNVEYEGQQINQQRTSLSNESSNYYSRLTSLNVPVPPSTADYTKTTYTFEDGTSHNTITSLIATSQTANSGIYRLNYVQSIPTDTIVASKNSVISRTGASGNYTYSIGNTQLRQAIAVTDPATIIINDLTRDTIKQSFITNGIDSGTVNSMSDEEIKNKLILENEYRAMAAEKYGTDDWYVYYTKNSSTGSYEPVFMKKNDVDNIDYDEKSSLSLGGVNSYVYGESTEVREYKNVQAKLDIDPSGRYKSITIYNDSDVDMQIIQVDSRTPEEITRGDEWHNQEPKLEEYVYDRAYDPELYSDFRNSSSSCYNNALNGSPGCYLHVLAHMLDLTLNENGSVNTSAYPKSYSSSISSGNDVTITSGHVINSAIQSQGQTPEMQGVSDAIKDGYTPEGKNAKATIIAGEHTNTTTDLDKYLSSYYLEQGSPTDVQRLLSNYKLENGIITLKSLEQKCVDLFRAVQLYQSNPTGFETSYNTLLNVLDSIDNDMSYFTLSDYDKYDEDTRAWGERRPENADPIWVDQELYTTKNGVTYNLIVTTQTDEKAYNDAMNQYYYDKAVYDQKIQEINSQIKIIQTQDKNLELKLKQLDTEENAIQTEIDAVKKVISKNVESSFRSFNA